MSRGNFLKIIFFGVALLKLVYTPVSSVDLHVWVAEGLKLLSNLSLMNQDVTSMHNLTFLYPSHLSNFLYGLVYKNAGELGLLFFSRTITLLTIYTIFHLYIKKERFDFYFLLISIVSIIGGEFLLDRPASLCLPFSIISLHLAMRETLCRKGKGIFFFSTFIWTNLHPSSILLVPVLGYRLVCHLFKKEEYKLCFILLGLSLVAIDLNPLSIGIWKYSLNTIFTSTDRVIHEWTNILAFKYPYYSILYLNTLAVLFWRLSVGNRIKEFILSPYFPLVLIGIPNVRNIVFLFLFLIPIVREFELYEAKDDFSGMKLKTPDYFAAFGLLGALIFLVIKNPVVQPNSMASIDKIETLLGERVFSSYEDSGYIQAVSKLKSKTFIDTRNIIFNDHLIDEYFKMIQGNDETLSLFDKYEFDTIVIPKSRKNLFELLGLQSKWKTMFENSSYALFRLETGF